jgi:sec-independent protein translocase protein TatA
MSTLSLFGFFGGIGPTELMVVCVVGLLLFGNRVPQTMRSIGLGLKEFKDGVQGIEKDIDREVSP